MGYHPLRIKIQQGCPHRECCGFRDAFTTVEEFYKKHEEVTKLWKAPFMAKSHSLTSSVLTILDDRVARGYVDILQVERVEESSVPPILRL